MKDNYDLSKLSVTPEPYEAFQRSNKPSKYEAIFAKTGEGMRLRCPLKSPQDCLASFTDGWKSRGIPTSLCAIGASAKTAWAVSGG